MMMLTRPKRKPRYSVQAPLTSLIDIVFLLLVFFLLTANFMADEGIDVKLPQAEASRTQTRNDITIHVDAQGRVFLNDRVLPLNELFQEIRKRIQGSPDDLVIIKADRTVILNQAVAVMDVVKAAGADRLCLATEKLR